MNRRKFLSYVGCGCCGLLVNFNLFDQEYGLYIPLDPFFIVGKLKDKGALLVEDDEFDKIQPLIETELEKSSS